MILHVTLHYTRLFWWFFAVLSAEFSVLKMLECGNNDKYQQGRTQLHIMHTLKVETKASANRCRRHILWSKSSYEEQMKGKLLLCESVRNRRFIITERESVINRKSELSPQTQLATMCQSKSECFRVSMSMSQHK